MFMNYLNDLVIYKEILEHEFMTRVKAIACADMTMEPGDSIEEKTYLRKTVKQFQASDKNLGDILYSDTGIEAISAGCLEHEYVPGMASNEIFNFFAVKGYP